MPHPKRSMDPRYPSPLGLSTRFGDHIANFVSDDRVLPLDLTLDPAEARQVTFALSGPRAQVAFHGQEVIAGIITCGGLCPGLNDVIRGLVICLWSRYEVRQIYGFRYGYYGLSAEGMKRYPPLSLNPEKVRSIHRLGGSYLGSSRGEQDLDEMVDSLLARGVNQLYCIGGDGTMRGATALSSRLHERGARLSVIGVPKTIDNDIPFVERTFGFDTAVSVAVDAVRAARAETSSGVRGVGVVQLMGRHAGFIAATAAIASREADLVLIPELPFDMGSLQGDQSRGVLPYLSQVLEARGEAVVIIAEGVGQGQSGQPLLTTVTGSDASGNKKLGGVGLALSDQLKTSFRGTCPINLKYIDPSYMIRAISVSTSDAIYCSQLAEDAAHAGMAGYTETLIGLWGGIGTLIPFESLIGQEKRVDLDGALWRHALEATGQPSVLS